MAREPGKHARGVILVTIAALSLVLLPMRDAVAASSVTSVTPSALGQGATSQNLEIAGSGFFLNPTVTFSGTGITVNQTTMNSASSITVNVTVSPTAAAGARTVTVTDLLGSASCTTCFTINAGPTVTSANPSALGQGASNVTVTLTGTGFVSGATVAVSGTGVTVGTVTFVNSTTLTAVMTVASGATTGARTITVTNPDHGVGTCSCLTINAGPTISSVNPPAGSNSGSLQITITGTGFVSGATVRLKKTSQSDIVGAVTSTSATQIVATFNLNLAAPGAWDVVVTNPDKGSATCAACFAVAGAAPTVTAADPDTVGQGAASTEVDLTGTHFALGATVTFSGTGITVEDVVVNSASSLTVTISVSTSAATTARDITVQNTDGQQGVCDECLTIATGPTATAVNPTSRGQRATNQPFEITGTGFVDGATVSFSGTGITVGEVTVDSPTSISTTISVSAIATTGTRDVIVTNPDFGRGTCAGCFTVNAAPTVSSLNPSAIGQGVTDQDITVTGTGFVNGADVTLSGTGVTVNDVTFNNATSLTVNVDVDAAAPAGTRDVTVTNPDAGNVTCAACLTINVSPDITSASPDHLGRGATSKTVALTGTGFVASSNVTISGTGVTINTVSFVDATHININVTVSGSATTGARTLTVSNPDGGTGSCSDCFSITPAPVPTSANPDELGQGASNVTVTLTGTGFVTGASVAVSGDGITVGTTNVVDDDTMTVVLSVAQTATPGARDITVTNTDFGTATCDDCLTINAAPTVTNVSPAAASNTGTSVLTITGTGFVDGATVTLTKTGRDPIEADPVEFVSATSLKATVDLTLAAPGAWVVRVDNPDAGTGSCTTCFTVAGSTPTVTSADPNTRGQGAATTTVEIVGTNFANGATVVFSGTGITLGTVDVVDATHIEVPVTVSSSAAAGARNITVTNTDGQSGTCTGCFTVTSAPAITSPISPAQRGQGTTNQNLSITGTGFASGIQATFSGSGITVNSVTFGSSTHITVNIDVAGGAALGARDVTLANPDGGTKTCTGCFTVTGPTTVTIATPAILGGTVVATFSQPVSGVSTSNFRLEVTGTTTGLAATITCTNQSGFATSCTSGSVKQATLKPSSVLLAGQFYTVEVAPSGSPAITDFGGLTVAPADEDFRASTSEQENSAGATYTWRNIANSSAHGGTYVVDHLANSRAIFKFTGTSVTWYTNTGPSYGIAKAYIDGAYRGTFNLYASSNHFRVGRTFLVPSGSHTFMVIVQGKKGSTAGTGTNVAVDAMRVGSGLYRTPNLTFQWGTVTTSSASAGKYMRSDLRNSSASFVFRGTGIDWYTVTANNQGKAEVYIDGVLQGTIDNYASSTHYGVIRAFHGLPDGIHTIRIRVLGTRRSSSSGNLIAVDRWKVI